MGLPGQVGKSLKSIRTWKKKARANKGEIVGDVWLSTISRKQQTEVDGYADGIENERKRGKRVAKVGQLNELYMAEAGT